MDCIEYRDPALVNFAQSSYFSQNPYSFQSGTSSPQGSLGVKREPSQSPSHLRQVPELYGSYFATEFPGSEYPVLTPPCSDAGSRYSPTSVNDTRKMPLKRRDTSGSPGAPPSKVAKTEQKAEDFSNSVKKRLQGSSRTGQACDRCKIRKIRCDGLPGGCSPCLQNQTECRTTDRITGRAAPRGYVEGLESQLSQMQNHAQQMQARINELEHKLIQHGIDHKPQASFNDASGAQPYSFVAPNGFNPVSTSSAYAPPSSALTMANQPAQLQGQPILKTGFSGDHYLGVSSGNSHLSSIKGTALSILGMEIDIADFESADMDEPEPGSLQPNVYNKSYHAFLMSTLNVNTPIPKVDLPSREDGFMYAQWYFRVLNPYVPILHQPTFMKLLTRVYDEANFRPTVAEDCMLHIVFAILFFQYAMRNHENIAEQTRFNNLSNLHYHYCLGKFYELSISHTLEDAQALTLICTHLRNFPKPGASWVLTSTTLGLAIELGLHRSVKHRTPSELMPNALEVEIRKRTFWCLLGIHVSLSAKLGRPIQIRMDDFDVELPDAVDDELLSEAGLDTTRTGVCSFRIGIAALKLIPIMMEISATIYSVRRNPETYIETVKTIEGRLRHWISECPEDLLTGEGGPDMQESRVFAIYTQSWIAEARMLLYHPSTSLTSDPVFNAESMKICVEAARDMQRAVVQLQKLKSLDTTWYQSAVYVMAITTTLFAQWERRDEMTAGDLAYLRKEMDTWLDVMGPVGQLLGSGTRLRDAVRNVTDGTLSLLSHTLNKANYSNDSHNTKSPAPSMGSTGPRSKPDNNQSYQPASYNTSPSLPNNAPTTNSYTPESHEQTPYPTATQYSSYPDTSSSTTQATYPTSSHQSNNFYSNTNTSDSTSTEVQAPLLAAFATQASQVPHSHSSNWHRPATSSQTHGHGTMNASQSWHHWTSAVAGNLEPQDCYSANALMSLGGNGIVGVGEISTVQHLGQQSGVAGDMSGMQGNGGITWPLNIFDAPQGQ